MTVNTIPAENSNTENRIVKGLPNWNRCERPGQKLLGSALLPNEKGVPTVYDVYIYGSNAEAIGLRYGNHPRDEHTHATDHWNRLKTPLALALKKILRQWIHEQEK